MKYLRSYWTVLVDDGECTQRAIEQRGSHWDFIERRSKSLATRAVRVARKEHPGTENVFRVAHITERED